MAIKNLVIMGEVWNSVKTVEAVIKNQNLKLAFPKIFISTYISPKLNFHSKCNSSVISYSLFDSFSILAHENKKYLLEIKESLIIMRDKPSLNRNINSVPIHLLDKVS